MRDVRVTGTALLISMQVRRRLVRPLQYAQIASRVVGPQCPDERIEFRRG
jgi:hypothetical protein